MDHSPLNELSYIESPPLLERILERTKQLGFNMASEPRTGALLQALAASKAHGRLLELGTGTGIAAAWLLSGMDSDSTLTSVDTDASVQAVAHEYLADDRRLNLVLGDALQFLESQQPESYDLVFADAMPGKYEGLSQCLSVVKPGGIYIIDDMLPQPNWPDGHAAKIPVLIEALAKDAAFRVVTIGWASGIVIAVKRGPF